MFYIHIFFLCPTITQKNVLPTIYLFLCSLGVKLYLFSLLESNIFSFHLIYRSRTAHQIFCFISFWKVLIYDVRYIVEDTIVSIKCNPSLDTVQSYSYSRFRFNIPVLYNTARISSLFKSHIKMQQKMYTNWENVHVNNVCLRGRNLCVLMVNNEITGKIRKFIVCISNEKENWFSSEWWNSFIVFCYVLYNILRTELSSFHVILLPASHYKTLCFYASIRPIKYGIN